MDLIDTHTHLYLEDFKADIEQVIERAKASGVIRCCLPNIDSETIEDLKNLTKREDDFFVPMIGIHPCSIKENYKEELEIVKQELDSKEYTIVGEIGLDFYWDKTFIQEQKDAFKQQCDWALERGLPVVIHTRESINEAIEILSQEKRKGLTGIFHCFSGTKEQANEIISLGYLLGVGGVLTFKNTHLKEVLASIPLDHLVLETDSPYLTPAPHRGRRNESAYIKHVCEKLAEIKQISPKQVALATTRNAKTIFNIV